MIITKSQTKSIKFERYKEESLISSQFFKNQKKKQTLTFFFLLFNNIFVGTHFETQTQKVKGYRPSEPSTINL